MVPKIPSTFRISLASLLVVAAACGTGRSSDAPASADMLPSLRVADSSLQAAVAARDAERVATFYSEDAVLMPVAEPIVEGRAAILKEWRHVFGIPGFANSSRLVTAAASGELAYTRGTYESPMLGLKGQQVIERGKWVSVWRREQGGRWRIVVDIFNTDSLPPDHQRSAEGPREQ